jgi:lysophospholipase L1-like esterase
LIQSLNSTIRTTARGENAVLVDVFGALSDDVTKYIGADGLHPTEAGYLKIAETFFAAIRADLER